MDQWHITNNEGFTSGVNLFPPKIPNNFRGCEIRVASVVLPPFVIQAGNITQNDGSIVYNLHGLAVHYFLLLADKINTTVVFLPPSYGFTRQNALASGMSDILIGAVLLLPVFLSSTFLQVCQHETVRPLSETCRRNIWSVCVVNNGHCLHCNECCVVVYGELAVQVRKGAGNIPNLVTLFLHSLVCYCSEDAEHLEPQMSFSSIRMLLFRQEHVFQAFFFSCLVQPGYGRRFQTVEEVLHSKVFYGHNEFYEVFRDMAGYKEHRWFPSSRRVDCSDMMECLQRTVTDADLCTFSVSPFIQHLSSQMGIHDGTIYLCALEEYTVTTGFISIFRKGSPHLNIFNILTVRVLEAGLLDRYWTELIWNVRLWSEKRVHEDDENMYFVFSLSRISPAFSVLMFGYVFRAVVFLSEIFFKKIRELQKCRMFNRLRVSPL
jgi:hypothetical protein